MGALRCDASTFKMLPISPPMGVVSGLAVSSSDVFVCSWPKSGTTWMQAIVAHLVAPDRSSWEHVSEVTPFYDAAASWEGGGPSPRLAALFAARGRRCWNTHVPWTLMPKGATYVYVVRDQRDALGSFWHHLRNQRGDAGTYEGSLADFAKASVDGAEPYGAWAAHLADWSHAVGDARVLFVRYEDMKADPRGSVAAVAAHLGIAASDAEIDAVVARTSFAAMKEDKARYNPRSVDWAPGYEFLRAGRVGDGAAALDDDAKALLDADKARRLDGITDDQRAALFGPK